LPQLFRAVAFARAQYPCVHGADDVVEGRSRGGNGAIDELICRQLPQRKVDLTLDMIAGLFGGPSERVKTTEPDPITGQHLAAQTVTLSEPEGESPERAGYSAKLRLRLAYHPIAIRVLSWVVETEQLSRSGTG